MILRLPPQTRRACENGSAMIITLIVVLLVSILVISLTTRVGLERVATHSSFETQRAREFGDMALDEVVATLRDNIPSTTMWAAAPGRLVVPNGAGYTSIPLNSGMATGADASTGEVDLNAPALGSAATNPIISPNTEYATAPSMLISWVEVLRDGTQVRNIDGNPTPSPGGSLPTAANPVVGRYAYWTDTETSKININTAGKGQTSYSFTSGAVPSGDAQNLSDSPSRVDLSQLDGGITGDTSVNPLADSQSLATFHFTYGGFFLGDRLETEAPTLTPTVPNCRPQPASAQGGQRFNSIQEWTRLPAVDAITGDPVTPITSNQVEENKFYITTQSNTPDVTPWGFNRMWAQYANDNFFPPGGGTVTYGNKINGQGAPAYPPTSSSATAVSYYPQHTTNMPDTRYFVYPWYIQTAATPKDPASTDAQFGGQYATTETGPGAFASNLMVQLNRTDWPGFPGLSFVQKYGQNECEDLAVNTYYLLESSIFAGGLAPSYTGSSQDPAAMMDGFYGKFAAQTVDGRSRLFGGIGEWPYLTQLSVNFQSTYLGTTNATMTDSYAGKQTYTWTTPSSGTTTNYTKNNTGGSPGFSPNFTSPSLTNVKTGTPPQSPVNIAIIPQAELEYPAGFVNSYYLNGSGASGGCTLVDVAVYATGTYNGQPVTYGAQGTGTVGGNAPTPAAGSEGPTDASTGTAPYYFGLPDNPSGPGFVGLFPDAPLGAAAPDFIPTSPPTSLYTTVTFPKFYVGPFDANTPITALQFRCRFVSYRQNASTFKSPMEIAPLAQNDYTDEQSCFSHIINGGASGSNNPPSPPGATAVYSPTFLFDGIYANGGSFSASVPISTTADETLEVIDPRVYRYVNDWTPRIGPLIPNAPSSIYQSSWRDPLTNIIGDDSKLAWPNVGATYWEHSQLAGPVADPRWQQSASNIEGFPGIGWLSVLPTNCESSQVGSPSGGMMGGIPWRTLSLEANQTNSLPDWLFLEAFAVAYSQTFCSQTEGKINVNAEISTDNDPQTGLTLNADTGGVISPARLIPLESLIKPATYAANNFDSPPLDDPLAIARDIAQGPKATDYSAPPGGTLPTNILLYPGQLCQISSLAGSGKAETQFQRESLMRNIAGIVTTQCSDYKVWVVAQAVKQVAFTGNPTTDLVVTGEQRMSGLVSRVPNLGPDNIPDTGDEPATPTSITAVSPAAPVAGSSIASTLQVTTPVYRYVISDVNYANN